MMISAMRNQIFLIISRYNLRYLLALVHGTRIWTSPIITILVIQIPICESASIYFGSGCQWAPFPSIRQHQQPSWKIVQLLICCTHPQCSTQFNCPSLHGHSNQSHPGQVRSQNRCHDRWCSGHIGSMGKDIHASWSSIMVVNWVYSLRHRQLISHKLSFHVCTQMV